MTDVTGCMSSSWVEENDWKEVSDTSEQQVYYATNHNHNQYEFCLCCWAAKDQTQCVEYNSLLTKLAAPFDIISYRLRFNSQLEGGLGRLSDFAMFR